MNLIQEMKVCKHMLLLQKVQMIKKVLKMLLNKVNKVAIKKSLNLKKSNLNQLNLKRKKKKLKELKVISLFQFLKGDFPRSVTQKIDKRKLIFEYYTFLKFK